MYGKKYECNRMKLLKLSFSQHPLSYIGIINVYKYSINLKDITWFKRSHTRQRISYEIIYLNNIHGTAFFAIALKIRNAYSCKLL